jgi:hypothetical protein
MFILLFPFGQAVYESPGYNTERNKTKGNKKSAQKEIMSSIVQHLASNMHGASCNLQP